MPAYLYCIAYTRMMMNVSSPSCDQRSGALQSQMSKASLKTCVLRDILNLVVSDIDLSSFGKLFHESGRNMKKPALQSGGEGQAVRSWCWLMNVASCGRSASSGTTCTWCGTGLIANAAHLEIWSHGHMGWDHIPDVPLHSGHIHVVVGLIAIVSICAVSISDWNGSLTNDLGLRWIQLKMLRWPLNMCS